MLAHLKSIFQVVLIIRVITLIWFFHHPLVEIDLSLVNQLILSFGPSYPHFDNNRLYSLIEYDRLLLKHQ